MKRTIPILAALALLLSGSPWVRGEFVTYNFSGTTTSASGAYSSLSGKTFTGSFTIDDSTPGSVVSSTSKAYYGAIADFTIHVGSTTFTLAAVIGEYSGGSSSFVQTLDNNPSGSNFLDGFILNSGSYNYTAGDYNSALQLNLLDSEPNPTALSSTALAGISLDLARFQTQVDTQLVRWDIHGASTSSFTVDYWSGKLASLQLEGTNPSAVAPEPSSLTLLGMAGATFAGYFGWRRRKQFVTA